MGVFGDGGTEREGFEPSVRAFVPYNRLAICRFRPLSHLSVLTINYHSTTFSDCHKKCKNFFLDFFGPKMTALKRVLDALIFDGQNAFQEGFTGVLVGDVGFA